MKRALLIILCLSAANCSQQTRHQQPTLTIVSVQSLKIGEAFDCSSIDMRWMEAHCFAPIKESMEAPKHKYLVEVTFDKPITADKNGWALDFTCRLDSYKAATCQWNKPRE